MTTEMNAHITVKEKQKMAGAVSGGIFLISLGVLMVTGWWWPGIMLALGLSGGASLVVRGRVWQGVGTLLFFCAIPLVIELFRRTNLDGGIAAAIVLIGLGVISLVRVSWRRSA